MSEKYLKERNPLSLGAYVKPDVKCPHCFADLLLTVEGRKELEKGPYNVVDATCPSCEGEMDIQTNPGYLAVKAY